jgi:hypothetical protein
MLRFELGIESDGHPTPANGTQLVEKAEISGKALIT